MSQSSQKYIQGNYGFQMKNYMQAEMYRSMWELAIDEILDQLVAVSQSGLTFLGQRRNRGMFSGKMEHLACYLPGNMALGVAEGAVSGNKAAYFLDVAANLTNTCFQLYNRTQTGTNSQTHNFSSITEHKRVATYKHALDFIIEHKQVRKAA